MKLMLRGAQHIVDGPHVCLLCLDAVFIACPLSFGRGPEAVSAPQGALPSFPAFLPGEQAFEHGALVRVHAAHAPPVGAFVK